MGKGKKKKTTKQADARGYCTSTTAVASKSKGAAAAAAAVNISATTHELTSNLLTDLKSGDGKGATRSSVNSIDEKPLCQADTSRYPYRSSFVTDRPGHSSRDFPIDPTSEKFLKKVGNIYDTCVDLSFKGEQVQAALQALGAANGSDFNLDFVLDWLCLNLPSEELPSLFIEQDVQVRALEGGGISVVHSDNAHVVDDTGRELADEFVDKLSLARTKLDESVSAEDDEGDVDAAKEKRAMLLAQYQYEDEDEDEHNFDGDGDGHDTSMQVAESQADKNVVDGVPIEGTSPEEKRLLELEKQIGEDSHTLNDDAALYMMSKYEVTDLKKRLKKAQGQAKGLRGKVAKIRAAREKERREAEGENDLEDGEEEAAAAFSLFGSAENDDRPAEDATSAALASEAGKVREQHSPPPLQYSQGRQYDFVITSTSSSIPKSWTGNTPRKILEDICRKEKLPNPKFSKQGNGCRIVVVTRPKVQRTKKSTPINTLSTDDTLTIEKPGPFYSYADAQQYLSTEAMYCLFPSLSLYTMLPPIFRSLWLLWKKEDETKKKADIADEESKRRANVEDLVMSIYKAYKENLDDGNEKDESSTNEERDDQVPVDLVEEDILADWDDQSSDEGRKVGEVSHNARSGNSNVSTRFGQQLKKDFERKKTTSVYKSILRERKTLPIYAYRESLLTTIRENAVTVLAASTGAGKSTNAPLFLLEEALELGVADKVSIICSQPRRVAAISVAERVSDELCEGIGRTVGYHIRMESKRSKETKLLFCTTGVILRRLQDDPNLEGVTHIVVDEVHERQWQIDFLLIALRRLLTTTRKDLKVILMSATIDSKTFTTFFDGAPFVTVPGRTFPVADYYLEDLLEATNHIIEEGSRYALRKSRGKIETADLWVTGRGGERQKTVVSLEDEMFTEVTSDDFIDYSMATRRSMERVDERVLNYDLIEDVLALLLLNPNQNDSILLPDNADNSSLSGGAVLVFLPGMGEIRSLTERLRGGRNFGNRSRFDIVPMHSSLSPKDQRRAFAKPRAGCQKIILATNICETSITIPDVVCVIDCGLVREVRLDNRSGVSTLVTDWCSRANAKQRAGRAGRVQPGICCRLFSSKTMLGKMREQSMPELQRVPLEEACLSILAGNLAMSCSQFLLQAPQPPSEESIRSALVLLEETGAIESLSTGAGEKLTALGQHLAKLPVHVRLGKMLVFGALFKCLDETLTIAASLSTKSPFAVNVTNTSEAAAAHRAFAHPTSDFFSIVNVWKDYQIASSRSYSEGRKFCDKNYLNHNALTEISDVRKRFLELLQQIGFVSVGKHILKEYSSNSRLNGVVDAVIVAGLYPNIARVEKVSRTDPPALYCRNDRVKKLFLERVHFHSSSVNHKAVSLASDWIVFFEKFATARTYIAATSPATPLSLLLFGKSIAVRHLERRVIVDDSIEIKLAAQTGVFMRELQFEINTLLAQMIENKGHRSINQERMVEGIVELLGNGHDQN